MVKFYLISLLIVFPTIKLQAQPSNGELLIQYISQQIHSHHDKSDVIYISLNPSNDFAIAQIQSILLQEDVQVTDSKEQATLLVRVLIDANNTLNKVSRNLYERSLQANVTVQSINLSTGVVQHSELSEFQFTDEFRTDDPFMLASSWYPTVFHNQQDQSTRAWLRRFVEPVLITSAVATTAYLLYNVRSQ